MATSKSTKPASNDTEAKKDETPKASTKPASNDTEAKKQASSVVKPTVIEKKTTISPKAVSPKASIAKVSVKTSTHTVDVSNETARIIKGFK